MRHTAFYILLLIALPTAFLLALAPWWDDSESHFVTGLLARMKPVEQGEVHAWQGPGVETAATSLVGGRLYAVNPPRAEDGRTYSGCAVVWRQMEVPGFSLSGDNWRPSGDRRVIAGSGLYIGKWAIDPGLFSGELAPVTEIGETEVADITKCPAGHDRCRMAESCVKLGDYTVLGNRDHDRKRVRDSMTREANGWMVMLPDPSLIDYPLAQAGLWTPPEFAVNYAKGMAGHLKLYSLYFFPVILAADLLMLLLCRRVNVGRIFANNPLQVPVQVFVDAFTASRDLLDHLGFWLAFINPFLPLAAYYYIGESGSFNFLLVLYVAGTVLMLVDFTRNLHAVKDPPPPEEPWVA